MLTDARKIDTYKGHPITPPGMVDAPLTPPSSHIELSSSTRPAGPSMAHDMAEATRSVSPADHQAGAHVSPSIEAHQRKVKRISGGAAIPSSSQYTINGHAASDDDRGDEMRGRSRDRHALTSNGPQAEGIEARSRTPSPILGSVMGAHPGRLSLSTALEPTPEEVRTLLYGDGTAEEEMRPKDVDKRQMDEVLQMLGSMGLANVDEEMQSINDADASRERRLASMLKKLIRHTQKQDGYIDAMEASLHDTRIRSIAMLSSLRTSFAHSFAAEYELRARLEAELEGAKLQASKLSQLLSRSETRNEELDRERAASAEEEVLWQEEMKDHASAYARQQAARARAAQAGKLTNDTVKREPIDSAAATSNGAAALEEPFDDGRTAPMANLPASTSDGSLTGLGIIASNATGPAAATIDASSAPAGSPLSTVIKERNKLLADKRYLKSRVRDAEAQRDRLELELKSLRPLLVRGVPSKSTVSSQLLSTPATPGRSQKRDRSRRRKQAMMGDAEAEHLLLAARRLQTTRAQKGGEEDGRPTTPPPHATPGKAVPRTPRTPRTAQTPKSIAMADSVPASGASSRMETESNGIPPPPSPSIGRSGGPPGRWGGHQRVDSARSNGGIDDLLHAAQTVLTPGERIRQQNALNRAGGRHPVFDEYEDGEGRMPYSNGDETYRGEHFGPSNPIHESPKRRRVSSAAMDADRRSLLYSPDKFASFPSRRMRTQTEGGHPHDNGMLPNVSQGSAPSALDLLADQAAASQQPSQSSEQSHSGEGETFGGSRSDDSDDGMRVDRHMGPNGTPHMGGHYYPRGAYGHAYAHPPPMGHEPPYRLNTQPAPYGYGPPPVQGSPVAPPSHGWTSQTVPPGRNGLYSPPSAHPRFALQSGPRLTSGYAPAMQEGSRLAKGNQMMGPGANGMHGGHGGHMGGYGGGMADNGYSDEESSGTQRTPQKGGNTSPDKRLPYVRWSEDEDQRLRRAIKEYGQRWESVAREVGTRTYHQCRQRFLLMRRKEAAAREGNHSGDDMHGSPIA